MWAVLAEHPSLLPSGCGRRLGTVWSNTDGQTVPERESLRLRAETGLHPLDPGPFPVGQKWEREGTREPPKVPGGSRARGGQAWAQV